MKKLYLPVATACFILLSALYNPASACYANFNHTNACAGDTAWFYGLDFTAVHSWDFGDSIANNPNMAFDDTAYHVYTAPGTYYVTHFVNIGAEWAFETQQITVGTNCFAADFDSKCGGSLYVIFENRSVGNNLSYSWNFGDPASGNADTSTVLAPVHSFSAAGNYVITLIIDNGTSMDTSIQSIVVDTGCMSAYISYQWNPCAGDTTFFYYNFIGVNSVYWDFGDPASGISNYSTLISPTHIFSAPGVYIGMVVFSNGIDTDSLPVVTRVVDCNVWPGDANRDGYVNGEDFFAVALYYGDTGAVRNNASANFNAQPATNWVNVTNLAYMYLQDLVDKKHADCNGDGTINAADVSVIEQNFGMSHMPGNTLSSMMVTNPGDPGLSIMLPASVSGTTSITAILNYGDSLIHTPLYAACIYIEYDPLQVDAGSITVDFSGSMLDSVSISNLITYYYNDVVNNRLVIVEARTDHYGMNNYGNLADIIFNAAPGYSGILEMHIGTDTKMMTNSLFSGGTYGNVQNIFKVNTEDASTQVSLGIIESEQGRQVSIYPTPARTNFHLDVTNSSGNYALKIIDAMGRILSEKYPVTNRQLIDVQDLSAGLYILQVTGSDWKLNAKLVVEK
ncbi:MAG: PKD domain-containing protein [Bacteroidota bacterium]